MRGFSKDTDDVTLAIDRTTRAIFQAARDYDNFSWQTCSVEESSEDKWTGQINFSFCYNVVFHE